MSATHNKSILASGQEWSPASTPHAAHRKVHEASVASMIPHGVAVYQLLLGRGLQLARHDGVDALNGTGSAERPARTCAGGDIAIVDQPLSSTRALN